MRALLPAQLDLGDLHPQLLERLALMVSGAPTQTMARYAEQKRIGLLLCWLWRLRTQLTDTALTISNDLIAGVLRRARNAAVKERQRQQKRIGQALKTCGEVVTVLIDKSIPDAELRATIAGYWDEEELQGLAPDCQELGAGPDAIYWGELRKRYSYVRQEDSPPPGAKSAEETLSIFRRMRDEIRGWMKRFITPPNFRGHNGLVQTFVSPGAK